MNEKLIKLLVNTLSVEQKYAIAVELNLTGKEAIDLLDFDCQQYGVPLKEEAKDEKPAL